MSIIEAKREETLPPVDFSAEAMATHYDPEAESYPDEGEPELMEIFLQQTNRSGLFLDIACGAGFIVRDLDERGRDALGLDISPKMIARAQRENPDIAGKFMVGDMTRLKEYFGKKERILAGITAFYAAIHVSKDQSLQLFEDCWDLLEEDGYMYIVMQMGTENEIVSHNPGEKKGVSLNIVSKEEQEAIADKAGFDIFASWSRPPAEGEHPYDKLHMILKKRPKQLPE